MTYTERCGVAWWYGWVPPGDWQHVASISSGGGWEWADFNAFYSPSERRYYWLGDSGCSCNAWGEDIRSEADMRVGSKEDLVRAARTFAKEQGKWYEIADAAEAASRITRWKPEQ